MSEPRDPVTGSDELSPKQLEAVNLLCTGMTQVATAEAIKVHRVTLSNWFRKDPRFRAELNRRVQDRAEATRVRVQSLVETSLDVPEESIKRDRDPKAAGAFLRLVGSQGFLGKPPAGPATFEEAAMQMTLEEAHLTGALRLAIGKLAPPAGLTSLLEVLPGGTESTGAKGESARRHPKPGDGNVPENRAKNSRTQRFVAFRSVGEFPKAGVRVTGVASAHH